MQKREWLNIDAAARYAGCSTRSVRSWWTHGLRGVRLASRLRVGRRYTTAGAIERFFRDVDAALRRERDHGRKRGSKQQTPRQRARAQADNRKFLRERGVV